MFLQLAHTRLGVYQSSQELVLESYRIARKLPSEERFCLIQQIRRAALSVHLNIAEGSSRKSQTERNRFFEISRGSVIEIDAAIGICFKLNYVEIDEIKFLGELIVKNFKQISGMIQR